jgi:hypothetical protein
MSSRATTLVGLFITVAAAVFQIAQVPIGVPGIVVQLVAAFVIPLLAAAVLASNGEDALEGVVLLIAGMLVVGVLAPLVLLASGLGEWAFRVPVLPVASAFLMATGLRRPTESLPLPQLGSIAPLIVSIIIVAAAVSWSSREQRRTDPPAVLLGLSLDRANSAQLTVSVDYLGPGAARYVLAPSWLGAAAEQQITVVAGHGWSGTLPRPRGRGNDRVSLRRATDGAVLRTVIWQVGEPG